MGIGQKTDEKVCILIDTQMRWKEILERDEIIYLYAMTGYGKTTQAIAFAKKEYKDWQCISTCDECFFDKIDTIAKKYENVKTKTLLIIDDLQWIFDKDERKLLFESILQIRKNKKIHVFLVSRAPVPTYLSPLKVTRQLAVENQEALRFGEEYTKKLMLTYPRLDELSEEKKKKTIYFCINLTKGYPLGVNAFYQRLSKCSDDYETASELAIQDIYDYLSVQLFGQWTGNRCDAVIKLSVYEKFDHNMAKEILGEQSDKAIHDLMEVGNFLQFKAPGEYSFVPFFHRFLETQLLKRNKSEWISLYEIAGNYYEKQRNYEQALRCYKRAGRQDKIAEIVIILSENAEGCAFARIAQKYIEDLSPDWEEREPRILGAKVMLAAYRMQPNECMEYMKRLKQLADNERSCVMKGHALETYVRTVIACPYDTADKLKDNLIYYMDYVIHNGFQLNNIMPTGNMPSVINGGLDLLSWENNKKTIYPVIKKASELIMGKEAVGVADACMGEILYEQNQITKSMAYLTKALSAANYDGSIRVQYAVTAIMSRLFLAEGQNDTAEEILCNLQKKIENEHFYELLPNLQASFLNCKLLRQDNIELEEWIKNDAPNEYDTFYITMRYQLIMKARVYTVLGKTMEALYILNLLENFAILYKRTYFQAEVLILKAIILYRRDEEWKDTLLSAVELTNPYSLVRIYADQGAALLPLWRQIKWDEEEIICNKHTEITKKMKEMAILYPGYLKEKLQYGELSRKEKEVLEIMAEGYNNNKIAEELGINLGTVKFHVANIMKKLGAENRTVAVKIAQGESLI